MKIDDFPDLKSIQYPILIAIRISVETNRKLMALKGKKKDRAETLRMLIDEGLKDVAV